MNSLCFLDPIIGKWPDRDWFSVPSLAGKWGMSPRTLRREIEAGRLRMYRVGRYCRVSIESAKQFEGTFLVGK